MTEFSDLFTSRQLNALSTLSDLIAEAQEQIYLDASKTELKNKHISVTDKDNGAFAYAQAVAIYLGMAVSRLSDIQNELCMWENNKTQIRHLFTRHAIPMLWDFAEGNAFSDAAGAYLVTLTTMTKVLEKLPTNVPNGIAVQEDAQKLPDFSDRVVSTDPPYYDNIGYADLSDFFYIWLRRSLKNIFPNIFSTMLVPKEAELIATPYRFDGNTDQANKHFEDGIFKVFKHIRNNLLREYPLTIYYAFKQEEIIVGEGVASTGWETMLGSLIKSGFSIVGTWPIRTELSNRMIASGTNALASSVVLVCRPRPEDSPMISRRDFITALRNELPIALGELQSGNIAPVDLAQASIGPGMAIYSRYGKVLEPNGERLSVRTALQLINQELDAYLTEQEGYIDEDLRSSLSPGSSSMVSRKAPLGRLMC